MHAWEQCTHPRRRQPNRLEAMHAATHEIAVPHPKADVGDVMCKHSLSHYHAVSIEQQGLGVLKNTGLG